MTFDEIREMVNETITANGQGNITGAALNTALNEILTAMSEFKPSGGGGSYTLTYQQVQTEENKAACKAIYDEIYPMIMGGNTPSVWIEIGPMLGHEGYKTFAINIMTGQGLSDLGSATNGLPEDAIGFIIQAWYNSSLQGSPAILLSDGTFGIVG